jgi:DNA-binding CsgD family transcriptional regulator
MSGPGFGETLEILYSAAAGDAEWTDALHAVEDLTGSVGAVIDFVPRNEKTLPRSMAGRFTAEQCAEYALNYQGICRRIHFAVTRPDIPLAYDSLVISEAEMDRDPVYDWLGKHGLRYYVASHLPPTENHLVYISLQRSRAQGHVQPEDLALFGRLSPHVTQAVRIAERLGTLDTHRRIASAVLEALPQAVLALDELGTILFANAAAERLLANGDGLVLSGRLSTSDPRQQSALASLIFSAGNRTGGGGGWMRINRASGRLPYALLIAPLATREDELNRTRASVLAVVHDPTARLIPSEEMLSHVYGLTPAQGRLATVLARGHSLSSAANVLGIQPSTARIHLKSIFRKLGISSQVELARILTALSADGLGDAV